MTLNYVPFGEKCLTMAVRLYERTCSESAVIEANVLSSIIRVSVRSTPSLPTGGRRGINVGSRPVIFFSLFCLFFSDDDDFFLPPSFCPPVPAVAVEPQVRLHIADLLALGRPFIDSNSASGPSRGPRAP